MKIASDTSISVMPRCEPGVRTEQVGNDAEGRQRDDVNLGVTEEPEQVLEQQRTAAIVAEVLALRDKRRHEEARAQQPIEHHHD